MIGVFDSGLGGLTVLRELIRAFPDEQFYYLGDTARLPYGSKTPETISKYVLQNLDFLDRQGCKAFVVACNSASTQVNFPEFNGKPVYTVIDPGVELACGSTENNQIGLIATEATVRSQVYQNKILAIKSNAKIAALACPLFVPLVEEGWHDDPITNLIVFRYLNSLKEKQIDTLILGCTHYPILEKSIQNVMGKAVKLIDSGRALAHKLKNILQINAEVSSPDQPKKTLMLGFTDFNTKTESTSLNILGQGLDPRTLGDLILRFEIVSLN